MIRLGVMSEPFAISQTKKEVLMFRKVAEKKPKCDYDEALLDLFSRELAVTILVSLQEVRVHMLPVAQDLFAKAKIENLCDLVKFVMLRHRDDKDVTSFVDLTIQFFLAIVHGLNEGPESAEFFNKCLQGLSSMTYCPCCELDSFSENLNLILQRRNDPQSIQVRRFVKTLLLASIALEKDDETADMSYLIRGQDEETSDVTKQ